MSLRASLVTLAFGLSVPALADDLYGCQKDTDCKGDRICMQNQCVTPPDRQVPPPPAYQQPPPQQQYQQPPPQYPQQPPPQYQQPPPRYYRPPPRYYAPPPAPVYYETPLIFGYSGMLGLQTESTSLGSGAGFLLDGYLELGGRFTPNFGIVGLGDLNLGLYNGGATETFTLDGGIRFGRGLGLTIGGGIQFLNEATATASAAGAGPNIIAHLSIPFWHVGWGFHLQSSIAFYGSATIFTACAGFGFSR